MAIRTSCPKCQAGYTVPDEQLGRMVRCKQCQEAFTVVAQSAPAAPGVLRASEPPVVEAVAPVRRPLPRRMPRRRQEEQASSGAGALVIAIVVVLGSLLVIAGAGAFIWYGFLREEDRSQANVDYTAPGPQFVPGNQNGNGDLDGLNGSPGATEPVNFEPKDSDFPDAGPKTFYPDAPIRPIANGGKPARVGSDGSLAPEVVDRVKAATVFLQVTHGEGASGEGSGFFAFEPGVIVTNAHVVGMMNANSPKPARIDVIVQSGEPGEQKLQGQLVAVDRFADLAVLRVKGNNLPGPLEVETSKVLRETQPVFVSGFPGGSRRGRNVAITPTHVDSLLKENGRLDRVQVRGAMLSGNSGGPVVDPNGHVIGVSVSVLIEGLMGSSSVNFAVPSDKVHHLLNGKVSEFTVGYPASDGDSLKATVRLKLHDPRQQTKRAALAWWIGPPGPPRPPAWTQPQPVPGDTEHALVPLKADGQVLKAELALKPLPEGQVYWLQPVLFGDKEDKTQWFSALVYTPPPIAEPKPVLLSHQAEIPNFTSALTTKSALNLRSQRGGFDVGLNIGAKLADRGQPTGRQRQYEQFDLGVRFNGTPLTRGFLRRVMSNRSSLPQPETPEFNQIPTNTRWELMALSDSITTTLAGLEVPLPGKEVPPGHTWIETRTLALDHLFEQHIGQKFRLKYTYRGMRPRDGRAEAIIEFEGEAVEGPASGTCQGLAWVDIATGQTALVHGHVRFDYDTHTSAAQHNLASISGKLEVRLQRQLK